MDSNTDITGPILIEIRNHLRGLAEQMTALKQDLAETKVELKVDMAQLGRRLDMTNRQLLVIEARLSTEISALRADLHDHKAI